jgi:hypothetical protein
MSLPRICFCVPRVSWLTQNDRPAGYFGQVVLKPVRQYYLDSYTNIRAASLNTLELIHDAFQSLASWDGWELPPDFQGVALDTHIYQILSNAVSPLMVSQDRIEYMTICYYCRA